MQERPELNLARELGVILEELLVREKTAHDVLRRIGAVDPDDQMLGPPVAELALFDQHAVREGEARRGCDLDRDRIVARVYDPAVDEHRALLVVDGEAEVLIARHQEVADVEARLKPDDVAPEQPFEDRVTHRARKHFPVLGGRPRDVHEMRDHRTRELTANQLSDQVELVVMDEDQRPFRQLVADLDHPARDLAIDLDVPVCPCAVHAAVDHWFLGQVPQVMLDEPQHRVRDD